MAVNVPINPVVNVPVTEATGTKPKQILSPPPPPPPPILPISDPIQTRSLTGHSRPAPGFMQNVKSTLNKVKDKRGKGEPADQAVNDYYSVRLNVRIWSLIVYCPVRLMSESGAW